MSSYTYMIFVQNGWYAIPNFSGLEEALRGNEEKRQEAEKEIKKIISSSHSNANVDWNKIVPLESFCRGLRETKIMEQYEKILLHKIKFSIHVHYIGARGWGHKYRVAHDMDLKDIVNFKIHRNKASAKRILRACGVRFPRRVDISKIHISFVGTLDWDMLFRAAKRLKKEEYKLLRFKSIPVEQMSHLDPEANIML